MKETQLQRKAALEQELERMLDVLIHQYEAERVLLFGSLASGRIHEGSDLDLVVVKQTDARFLDRIAQVLELLHPRLGIDVLVYTPEEFERLSRERAFFRNEVLAHGKVLYERNG